MSSYKRQQPRNCCRELELFCLREAVGLEEFQESKHRRASKQIEFLTGSLKAHKSGTNKRRVKTLKISAAFCVCRNSNLNQTLACNSWCSPCSCSHLGHYASAANQNIHTMKYLTGFLHARYNRIPAENAYHQTMHQFLTFHLAGT